MDEISPHCLLILYVHPITKSIILLWCNFSGLSESVKNNHALGKKVKKKVVLEKLLFLKLTYSSPSRKTSTCKQIRRLSLSRLWENTRAWHESSVAVNWKNSHISGSLTYCIWNPAFGMLWGDPPYIFPLQHSACLFSHKYLYLFVFFTCRTVFFCARFSKLSFSRQHISL